MPDLVRQIFAVEAQPCERDAHVLDHEQADDARVVGQVGSRRDGRAEEGGKDDGGRGTGVTDRLRLWHMPVAMAMNRMSTVMTSG